MGGRFRRGRTGVVRVLWLANWTCKRRNEKSRRAVKWCTLYTFISRGLINGFFGHLAFCNSQHCACRTGCLLGSWLGRRACRALQPISLSSRAAAHLGLERRLAGAGVRWRWRAAVHPGVWHPGAAWGMGHAPPTPRAAPDVLWRMLRPSHSLTTDLPHTTPVGVAARRRANFSPCRRTKGQWSQIHYACSTWPTLRGAGACWCDLRDYSRGRGHRGRSGDRARICLVWCSTRHVV